MKIARTVPQFFTTDFARTVTYYQDKLGFAQQFAYGEPVVYGGLIRDDQSIFLRHVDQALPVPPGKFNAEYLDAYLIVEDVAALFAEYEAKGVHFHRPLDQMPWDFREFVVRDCDDRLLCFGEYTGE